MWLEHADPTVGVEHHRANPPKSTRILSRQLGEVKRTNKRESYLATMGVA